MALGGEDFNGSVQQRPTQDGRTTMAVIGRGRRFLLVDDAGGRLWPWTFWRRMHDDGWLGRPTLALDDDFRRRLSLVGDAGDETTQFSLASDVRTGAR